MKRSVPTNKRAIAPAAIQPAFFAFKGDSFLCVARIVATGEIVGCGCAGITSGGGAADSAPTTGAAVAGAAAVEVGTANYFDPCATEKIVDGVRSWCIEHRVERVSDLIGALKVE